MGYRIGTRLIEEFIVKSQMGRCKDFRDTADVISKVAFKMYLNVTPTIANMSADGKSFTLIFDENPLSEFVELPIQCKRPEPASSHSSIISPTKKYNDSISDIEPEKQHHTPLWYSNILCGVIRGSLEMLQLQVEVKFVSDVLLGDEQTEISIKLIKVLEDEIPIGED